MSPYNTESALFEALNAKKLSSYEIAQGFVLSAQYEQLVSPDHAYLVGPRGSGKTTLLRMLEGPALMAWNHRRAPEFRRRVSYSSVFLPADRLWAAQIGSDSAQSDVGQRLGTAAFGTQMLYGLVETLRYRLGDGEADSVHLGVSLSHQREVQLVAECAEAWQLPVRVGSIEGLQAALDLRLLQISNVIDESADIDSISTMYWLNASPLAQFRYGIRAINRACNQPDHRWALLLDEMELAPPAIHRSLMSSLRGGDRNIVVKLSFSPFDRYIGSMETVGGAVANNDFKPIYLWYGNRLGGRKFTGGLWRRMIQDRYNYRPAIDVLGPSKIDISGGGDFRRNTYSSDGEEVSLIKKMSSIDPGLATYLKDHSVDLDHLEELSYNSRSATLRKIYPLVVFRDALLEAGPNGLERRSRKKVTECFTGVDAVFAALEGNPRWSKAVFSELLSLYEGSGRVRPGTQYDVLLEASERFESLLRVLSFERRRDYAYTDFSVLELLDSISKYFSDRNLGDFTADPPSVFRVDRKVPGSVLSALEAALSAGAIIHLRGKSSPTVLGSLVGERFRLAYLLTIRDRLEVPFRIGKTVALSRILQDSFAGFEKRRIDSYSLGVQLSIGESDGRSL